MYLLREIELLRKEKIHILANPTSAYCQDKILLLEHFGLFLNPDFSSYFQKRCVWVLVRTAPLKAELLHTESEWGLKSWAETEL